MDQCPKCKSADIHRSRAKTRWERWRQRITEKRPYRCRGCNWRGWGPDLGPKFGEEEIKQAEGAMTPDAIDFHRLDAAVDLPAKRDPSDLP